MIEKETQTGGSLTQDELINDFAKRLLNEKGLSDFEPEMLAQMQKDLVERIEDGINAMIVENMPAEELPKFRELLENGTDEEVQVFCEQNIEGFADLLAQNLLRFREIYLGKNK